jgi:hypothetical protein
MWGSKLCIDYPGPANVPQRQTVVVVPAPRQQPYYPPGVTVCDPLRRWDPDCTP